MQISSMIKLNDRISFDLFGNTAGISLVGASGMGKTTLLTYILLVASKIGAQILIIDVKRADLASLSEVLKNGEKVVAATADEACRLLRVSNNNLNRRFEKHHSSFGKNWKDYHLRPVIIVCDETSALMAEAGKNKAELIRLLRQIVLRGRQGGMFTILGSQRLEANVVDRSLTLQLGTRIVMGHADNDTYRMAYPALGDMKLLPFVSNKPGHGLILSDSLTVDNQTLIPETPQPFIAPNMAQVDVPYVLNELQKRADLGKFIDEPYWEY